MLIARSLLRAAPGRIAHPAAVKPLSIPSTTQWLNHKASQSSRPLSSSFPSQRKHHPSSQYNQNRPQRQEARQDAAAAAEAAEFDPSATPSRNTAPTSQPGPTQAQRTPRSPEATREYSEAQEEFDSPQSPQANTTPSSQPSEAETGTSNQSQFRGPLPDLRQGIPSTFAEEFLNKKATSTPEEADNIGAGKNNITDDPRLENTEGPGDGAGRDQGEMPKGAYQTSIDKRRDAMMKYFYIAFATFLGTGAVYFGRNWDTEEEEKAHPDAPSGWSFQAFWDRIMARMNSQRSYYTEPTFPKLLPEMDPAPPYTLVLSLEDMLIHSEWTREHGWRTAKRPGVDYFLGYLSQYYELVLFTTMPMAYADQIVKKLDPYHFMTWPLFREATRYDKGEYVKDLSYLNRPLSKTIIIDTKAGHVKNQPENAIILSPWKGDRKDRELVELIPYLEHIAAIGVPDVRQSLKAFEGKHIPTEFTARLEASRAEFNKKLEAEKARKKKGSAGGAVAGWLGIKPQGGMTYDGQTRVTDELEKGKMLADQIRENGIRQYERIEKEIRENGEKWLAEEKEMEKKMIAETANSWKKSMFGFGGGPETPAAAASS